MSKYTSLQVVGLIYEVVNSKKIEIGLDAAYKYAAPTNSNKVNAVVNSLTTSTDTLQVSMININTFVPNVEVSLDGTITYMPNLPILDALDKKYSNIFAEYVGDDFIAYIVDSNVFQFDKHAVLNFKIRVNLFNNKK